MKMSKNLKNSGSLVSFNNKKPKKPESTETGIKLEEDELTIIRSLLTKSEVKELDLMLNKKNTKNQTLKPLSKEVLKLETHSVNTGKNIEEVNQNEKPVDWKHDTCHLDDYQFRKTLTKKNEKLVIDDSSFQNDKSQDPLEITKILNTLNLMKYHDVFVENCLDDLYSILEIKENHLIEMKIEQEDIKLILDYINNLKENVNIINEVQKINFNNKNNFKCEIAVGSDNLDDDINKIEEEERKLFQKALEEYRNSLKSNKDNSSLREANSNKYLHKTEQGIGTSELININKTIKKYPCWECYKIKNFDIMITSELLINKYFCSIQCKGIFYEKNIVKCEACGNLLEKVNGYRKDSKIYCHYSCFQSKNERNETININKKINPNYDPMLDF